MHVFPPVFSIFLFPQYPGQISDLLCLPSSLATGPEAEESDEAEYAWLPLDFIKPFQVGDVSGTEGAPASEDENLRASIAEAEAALRAAMAASPTAAGSGGGGYEECEGDSDGGWGLSSVEYQQGMVQKFGRGGGGSRWGKASRLARSGSIGRGPSSAAAAASSRQRPGRRAGGRSDDDDDDADVSVLELPPDGVPSSSGPKDAVDEILGWRHPQSDAEREHERSRRRAIDLDRVRLLAAFKAGEPAALGAGGTPSPIAAATQFFWPGPAPPAEPAVDPMAVLALGGMLPPAPPPANPNEPEYLVRWRHKSHAQNEWVKEGVLLGLARRKLLSFRKRYGAQGPCVLVRPEWLVPERFVTRRPCPAGPGWEVLVHWTGLGGYEGATWEVRGTDGGRSQTSSRGGGLL